MPAEILTAPLLLGHNSEEILDRYLDIALDGVSQLRETGVI